MSVFGSEYDNAVRASEDYCAALRESGQWDDHCAEEWFTTRNTEIRRKLYDCLNGRPKLWREAACFSASLSDLCLWAQRAEHIGWAKAKAGFEKTEREAEAPELPADEIARCIDIISGKSVL